MVSVITSHIRIFATLILSFCLLAIAHGQTPREIAKITLPSVVLVVGEDDEGKAISSGSGFFVREGIIATNNHVIEGASSLYAKTRGSKKLYPLRLIIARPRTDLALFIIDGVRKPPLPLANFNQVEIGDEIYAVGNPAGLEGTFSQGLVSGIRKLEGKDLLQISAPITHGSSGGPILNKSGKVIGVAVGGLGISGNLNFAIPVSELTRLLGAAPKAAPKNPPLDLTGLEDLDLTGIEDVGKIYSYIPTLPPSQLTPNTSQWELVSITDSTSIYRSKNYSSKTPQSTLLSWEQVVPRTDRAKGIIDRLETIKTIAKAIGTKRASEYSYYIKLEEYDCRARNKRALQFLFYDRSGNVLHEVPPIILDTEIPKWFHPPSQSIGATLLNAVCK